MTTTQNPILPSQANHVQGKSCASKAACLWYLMELGSFRVLTLTYFGLLPSVVLAFCAYLRIQPK